MISHCNYQDTTNPIPAERPIAISSVVGLYAITCAAIAFGLYWLLPELMKRGMQFLPAYLLVFHLPFAAMFFLTFVLYTMEGGRFRLTE